MAIHWDVFEKAVTSLADYITSIRNPKTHKTFIAKDELFNLNIYNQHKLEGFSINTLKAEDIKEITKKYRAPTFSF